MRPTVDQWAMRLAAQTALRGTCLRRRVGCVLLNKRGHVIGTGYNGVARGVAHCNHGDEIIGVRDGQPYFTHPFACPGATAASGTNLAECQAIHAEQNALIQCKDPYELETCYTTTSPCDTCTKMLMATSCTRIVYLHEYPHQCRELWLGATSRNGRTWEQLRDPMAEAFLTGG